MSSSQIDLFNVLSDPSCLAYWLEYMERRNRSRLVQLWLTIEGFKDPLEGLGQNPTLDGTLLVADQVSPSSGQSVREDLRHLHATYLSNPEQLIVFPPRAKTTITELSSLDTFGPGDVKKAKQAMFATQQAVYEQMEEEDWDNFKKTELYLKASTDLCRQPTLPAMSPTTSPSLATSAFFPASPTPPMPSRQMTAPLLAPSRMKHISKSPTSPATRLPTLLAGQLSPASVTAATSISFTPPEFERRSTLPDLRSSLVRNGSVERMDLSSSTGSLSPSADPRRSMNLEFLIGSDSGETHTIRQKLFEDEDDDGVLVEEDEEELVQAQRMEAIQAALNDIISDGDLGASQTLTREEATPDQKSDPSRSPSSSLILTPKAESKEPLAKLTSRSIDDLRSIQPRRTASSAPQSRKPSSKPSELHRSTSTSNPSKKSKHIFDDELTSEDEREGGNDTITQSDLQVTIPGDMQLDGEIRRLQEKIEELVKQEHLLDSLMRQAELTGNAAETRLLERSIASVRREQRTAIFQKAQFEQQEEEHRLVPGLTKVTIPTAVVSDEGDIGKPFVRYHIRIQQGQEVTPPEWTILRRYNEFWELDKGLREWAGTNEQVKLFQGVPELPPKKLVPNLSASFIESRRQGLERYLQVSVPMLGGAGADDSLLSLHPCCAIH